MELSTSQDKIIPFAPNWGPVAKVKKSSAFWGAWNNASFGGCSASDEPFWQRENAMGGFGFAPSYFAMFSHGTPPNEVSNRRECGVGAFGKQALTFAIL